MLAWKILTNFTVQRFLRSLHTSNKLCEAVVINGKDIAAKVLQEVKIEINKWTISQERKLKLVAIIVGNHPASKTYVKRKVLAAKSVGIESETLQFTNKISQEELLSHVNKLNEDPTVDGILIQLPVPEHMNERELCQSIIPTKDIDGFHLNNIGSLALNRKGIIPATALGVKELLIRSNIITFKKSAVVIGRSKHVGLPIALLLHSDSNGMVSGLDMTTTLCHRYTPHADLVRYTKLADVIVSCAGVPGLVTKEMIKPGACVIDVGISRIPTDNGTFKLVGDVSFESVKNVAGYITPVPGGVGPMTVAMLIKNTLLAAQLNKQAELMKKLSAIQ